MLALAIMIGLGIQTLTLLVLLFFLYQWVSEQVRTLQRLDRLERAVTGRWMSVDARDSNLLLQENRTSSLSGRRGSKPNAETH